MRRMRFRKMSRKEKRKMIMIAMISVICALTLSALIYNDATRILPFLIGMPVLMLLTQLWLRFDEDASSFEELGAACDGCMSAYYRELLKSKGGFTSRRWNTHALEKMLELGFAGKSEEFPAPKIQTLIDYMKEDNVIHDESIRDEIKCACEQKVDIHKAEKRRCDLQANMLEKIESIRELMKESKTARLLTKSE